MPPQHEIPTNPESVPSWTQTSKSTWGTPLSIPEWGDDTTTTTTPPNYRPTNGWHGTDLCHASSSPVRVHSYHARYAPNNTGVGTRLTGFVDFTPAAESHRGYCHGGSMCSVMDDVIGWTGFLVTGSCVPWSGFTAQVNTAMKRPVKVGSVLVVTGEIVKWEGRKVSVEAELVGEDGVVHASAEGLFLLKKEYLEEGGK